MNPTIIRKRNFGFSDKEADDFRERVKKIREEVHREIVGLDHAIDALCVALLAGTARRGHVFFEAAMGRGKTLLIKVLADVLNLKCSRVQGTPDHEPLDFYYRHELAGKTIKEVVLYKGPVFTNILLVDELNRIPPKSQSGLLEPMEEAAVTFEGILEHLDHFHLFATQNPIETEGTYSVPEALLDRFMLKIPIDFPKEEELRLIIARDQRPKKLNKILDLEELARWNELVYQTFVMPMGPDSAIVKYIARILHNAYLHPAKLGGIRGESPSVRPGEDMRIAAGINAFLNGRDKTTQEDVKKWALPTLRGRYAVSQKKAQELGFASSHLTEATDSVIKDILANTPFVVNE